VRGVILGAALLAAVPAATAGRAAPQATCGKLLPPAQGAYFGAKPGWGIELPSADDFVSRSDLDKFERAGRPIVITAFSQTFHDGLPFPLSKIRTIWSHGEMPIVRLFTSEYEDYGPNALPKSAYPGPITHSKLVAGTYDGELRAWARAAAATNIPIGLDYDAEMNNDHPWGGRFDGGKTTDRYGDPSWPDGPELYRDAFRHIVTLFREEGATNVTFFFQVDAPFSYTEGSYSEPFERYRFYYPGDDYVDWVGFSVYGQPNKPDGTWTSFAQKLQDFHDGTYPGAYADLTSLSSRPVAVLELGWFEMPEAQKAAWVRDAAAAIESRFTRIKYVHWWGDNQGAEYDAWPASSTGFQSAFKAAWGDPYFDAIPSYSGNCLPSAPAGAVRKSGRASWRPVPNATAYELWLGPKLLHRTSDVSVEAKKKGAYRVRALNPVGAGPFATVRNT
jgi:Glycosyl hydrolase family 26